MGKTPSRGALFSAGGAAGLLFALLFAGTAQAGCSSSRVPATIKTDTTYDGTYYINQDTLVDSNATLTLKAGTELVFCGNYHLRIGPNSAYPAATLKAEGKPGSPVVMRAKDPNTNWRGLQLRNVRTDTELHYMEIRDSGGNKPSSYRGALYMRFQKSQDQPDAVIDHVTIENSGGLGVRWKKANSD
ncbi:MAG TPA: hypothetical protein VKA48_13300, partial [Gammaproteobacteria bacterium]|nr:hypothetical protein [Gammaproteobacteria bacterium]